MSYTQPLPQPQQQDVNGLALTLLAALPAMAWSALWARCRAPKATMGWNAALPASLGPTLLPNGSLLGQKYNQLSRNFRSNKGATSQRAADLDNLQH